MTTPALSSLGQAQVAQLAAVAAQEGSFLDGVAVVTEDIGNILQTITEKLAALGMLVFIGEPAIVNNTQQGDTINGKAAWQILVREFPEIWRDGTPGLPHCSDVALAVAAALQFLPVTGFGRIRVVQAIPLGAIRPDEKKQIEFHDYRIDLESPLVTCN